VDPIVIPQKDDLAPLDEMVRQALANRSDLAVEKANTAAATVSAIGTKNGVRPDLVVFGAESHAGLSGAERTVTSQGASETADPFFSGGIGNALGQIFRRNFPTERIGAFYGAQIHNWQAQADYSIDQLQLRQSQLTTRKDLNQVEVDVLNGVVSLQQARARYEAAERNRVLQEELLAAEQKRFALGTSTPYNVIQQQRDMVNAQSSEVAALAAYATARISLDRTLGATLTANHISLTEAREGRVARPSAIREPAPAKP
ncbi:MAG TPA: TolC family protein, partial [Bryobacteraceae bacterium]|nr:TolC family protein [Bryobacteraceae bacterium]